MTKFSFSMITIAFSYSHIFAAPAATTLVPIEISSTPLVKSPSLVLIQDNEFKTLDTDKDGFITQGIGPCFAFLAYTKDNPAKALAMYHYAPVGSQAKQKEAYEQITQALHSILYLIEKMLGIEFEEEKESPDKHPLYQVVSIAIFGGQPSSQNSIDAINQITYEQYFPISQLCLDPSQGREYVFDLIFSEGKLTVHPFHTE